ncbi:MAG TPA: hypothetical protein PLV91_02335 [Verrucomicrobiota bacterium]|nr:hypothetical protein [Verrucomicrobiota bacterium]
MKNNWKAKFFGYSSTLVLAIFCSTISATSQSNAPALPGEGGTQKAIELDYFPDRLHAFIFKNWPLVHAEQLAKVLETKPENVVRIAESMGLPPQDSKKILPAWRSNRGYITVLRRNWHLLPYDQLLTLLDITRQELQFRLIEDDFLYVKLGNLKPNCEKLVYTDPSPGATAQAKRISEIIRNELKENSTSADEERFEFINRLKDVSPEIVIPEKTTSDSNFELRYISSYFASFGEPLLDPEIESCPEGLLQRLSAMGVNGVWIHTVLRTLAPPTQDFPEFGQDHERRIQGLNKLVQRAKKYGIGIYLYSNEPRALPVEFFNKPGRENMKGVTEGHVATMCSSDPRVRKWLTESYEYVFKNVPDLAGVFTITGSENLTTCASHYQHKNCAHCSNKDFAEITTDINTLIAEGVHRGNSKAKTIVWDWGWQDQFAEKIIKNLPKSCWFQSVSEWSLPISRGGVSSSVGEYSLSAVGPGPRAQKHWQYAREAGLKTVAKVQVNATWEFASIPQIPVLNLAAQHAANLSGQKINGLMLSWSLGGYPSINLSLFRDVGIGNMGIEESLKNVAVNFYGDAASDTVLEAWKLFSDGFSEYPYSGGTIYLGPQHMGPANPLYLKPTGYKASMVGIPYDDLAGWCSIYPPKIWIQQMELVRDGFSKGCDKFEEAIALMPPEKQNEARVQLGQYRAAEMHFSSCINQARFTDTRNAFYQLPDGASLEEKEVLLSLMQSSVENELIVARRIYTLVNSDSAIGYESSNHYFYIPQDILEKIVNCKHLLMQLENMKNI